MSFGRFPNEWVLRGGLSLFSEAVRPGESLAALKVYLLIAAYSDFQTWTAVMSFSEIEEMTRLSRPMVNAAIKILIAQDLIVKKRIKQTSAYEISNSSGAPWAKVPQDRIRFGLRSIPNRGRISLGALKTYVLLLVMRNNSDSISSISYRKIWDYTRIRQSDIRLSLSILVVSGFTQIAQAKTDKSTSGYAHNVYHMLGDFSGEKVRHNRPKMLIQHEALDIFRD